MGKIKEYALKAGKFLTPAAVGGAVFGVAKICETNLKAAEKTPDIRDNYMDMSAKTVGILTAAALAVVITWKVCDSLEYSSNRRADAEYEAIKATFGGRRRNDSSEDPKIDPEEGNNNSNDGNVKTQKAEDIKGSYENYDDGQLLGQFIYKGDTVIWYGTPGSGKSTAALQMAIDLAQGNHSKLTLNSNDNGLHKPVHVIYYDGEMDNNDFVNFFGTYDRSQLDNLDFVRDFYYDKPINWISDVEKRLSDSNEDAVVFLDNASCVGLALSADSIRSLFLNNFRKLKANCEKRGFSVTFIVIAHTNKDQKLYGSSNFHNFCSAMLKMERIPSQSLSLLTVEKCRKYGAEMQDKVFKLKFSSIDGHKGFENTGEEKQGKRANTDNGSENKEPMFDSYTLSQVQELYDLSKQEKPNPRRKGNVPLSARDIAEKASFEISHTKVCDLIRQYKEYLATSANTEQDTDESVDFVEEK